MRSDASQPQIVVIGAGPVGLAAAIAAAQEVPSAVVTVLEKRCNLYAIGVTPTATFHEAFERKNFLQINLYTLHQLERLGALDWLTLLNGIQRFESMEIHDERSLDPRAPRRTYTIDHTSRLADTDKFETATAAAIIASNMRQHVCGTPVAILQQALYHTAADRGINVVFGISGVTVERNAQTSACVRYVCPGGKPLCIHADLLIVAEGAGRAITRRDLKLEPKVSSTRQYFLYAFLATRDLSPYIFFHRKRSTDPAFKFCKRAIICNTTNDTGTIFYVQIPRPLELEDVSSRLTLVKELQHMRELFDEHLDGKELAVDPTVPVTQFSVQASSLPAYSVDGKIVVVGDAERTGLINSGVAFSVSLVCDINALRQLVRRICVKSPLAPADSVAAFSSFFDAAVSCACIFPTSHMELAFLYE